MKILNSKFKILGAILVVGVTLLLFQLVGLKTSPETERIIYPQAQLVPLTPNKTLFKSNEAPQFTLKLGQKQEERQLIYSPLKTAFAETEPKVVANVYYGNEPMNDQIKTEIQKNGGDEYNITLPQPNSFRPGQYRLEVTVKEDGAYQNFTQDFRWGVLAINTNKSIYKEYETAKIYFGVLDESGHTICDAKLRLQILNSKSEILNFSTEDGTIKYSGECGKDNFTYTPDYSALYKVGEEGIYQMELTAQTKNGEYQISDFFEVRKDVPFEIERIGPTRINPVSPYDFKIKVKANQDFEGEVAESVPKSYALNFQFPISNFQSNPNVQIINDQKTITWQVNLKKGQTQELVYQFDAPNISPEFYLLGPIRLRSKEVLFEEARRWQIASDAISVTTLGTNQDKNTTQSWTALSSITLSTGESIIVITSYDGNGYYSTNPYPYITWNGQALSNDKNISSSYDANGVGISIQSLHNVTGATGNIVIEWSSGTVPVAQAMTTYKASGLATSNTLDKTSMSSGTGTDASTGSTGTLSQADELAIAATGVEDEVDDAHGTWTTGSGYVSGNEQFNATNAAADASNVQAHSVAMVVSSTTALQGVDAGHDSSDWAAVIATYKAPPTIDISGRVCSGEPCTDSNGSAACSTANVVGLSVNGGTPSYASCNSTTGAFSFSGVLGDSTVTLFLNDVSQDATLVMKTASSAITDADFYDSKIVVRAETGTVGTTEMAFYDSDNQPNDIRFQAVASTSVVVESGNELHVWTGDTFDPGGTVTTNTTGGVFHIDDSAIAYLDTTGSNIGNNITIDASATLNIDANSIANGNITIDGSLTKSTGSPTLTLRGTNNISGAGATKSFYILAVGDATATSATTISSSITVTGGALTTYGASTIASSGTPNVNISAGTGNIGGGSGSISFYDLTIGGTQTLQSNITVSNNLSVSSSLALNDKNINVTNGNFATTGSGTITCTSCSAGTATLSGTGNIGGGGTVTVYNLTVNGSYTLQTATTANNDISVGTGATLALNGKDLTVGGGDLTTTTTGQITCTSCSTGTTTVNGTADIGIGGGAGAITFYNLTIGGTIPIVSAITVSNDLTANGTMSGSVNVTVNGTVAGTGTINMSGGTFDQRVSAAENFGTTSGSNPWTFSTLKFTNSSSASRTISTQAASGGITVSTLLQIGNDGPTDAYPTVLDAGNRTWTLSATNGTPFDIKTSTNGASTLTGGTSTFTYTGVYGSGDTNVQATTGSSYYYNLTFNGTETYAAEGAIVVNNDLTITTGTFSLGVNNLTVGTDTTTGDISVAGSLTQSASGTTTVKTFNLNTAIVGGAGTLTFYNLSLSPTNSGGTIRLGSAASQTITVSGNLTVGNGTQSVIVDANTNDPTLSISGNFSISSSGTFQAPSYTTESFTIGGTYNNSGAFTHDSGKITFNGSGTGKTLTGTMTSPSPFGYLTFNGSSGVSWTFGSNSATVANDLSIAANNTVTAPSTTLTITGNYSNSGTFTHNSGEVVFNAGDTGNTLIGTMTGSSSFYNLEFNNSAGAWSFAANSATVANNFTITNTTAVGGVTAPSTTLTIGGNFTKSAGTFSHNNGTVAFNDNTKSSTLTYNAAITFYGFSVTTDNKQLYFDNVYQANVTNSLTINPSGANCSQMVKLYSDSSGNQYDLNVTAASPTIQYADVKDSNAVTSLTADNSKSSGNVSGWTINGGVCGGVTVSGNAYTDEQDNVWTGCNDSTLNISLVVSGTLQQTEKCNASTGAYAFYTVTVATDNPVSVFFNTAGGNTDKGVAITVAADNSSSITLNPRKNITWVKTEGAVSSISNANLDHCDSGSPPDCTNVPYSVTTNNLTVGSGVELHIESSKTYDPGGTVTTNATGGDLHVDDNATAYLDNATSSIGRDALIDGGATLNIQADATIGRHVTTSGTSAIVTYTNTPTVTFSGTSTVGGGTTPSITFYNLTVDGTMTGSSNITVNGAVAGTGTIGMSAGTTFEQRVGANQNFGTTSGTNNWTFTTLIFSNSDGVNPHTITTQSASGGITVSTLLQIGKAGDGQTTTLNAGNRTWTLSGTSGTPFDIIGSSALSASTSTFSYTGANGSGDTIVQTATYYHLIINASDTFVPDGDLTVNGDLTVTTGSLAMGSNNLVVGSSSVDNSGDISVAGSLTQTGGTTTVKAPSVGAPYIGGAGTLTFYNLTLAPTIDGRSIYLGSAGGQTITVSNDLTIGNGLNTVIANADTYDPTLDVNGNFSIASSGTFQSSSGGTFQVAKNFTNNGTFTHNSGTVTFDTTNTSIFNGSGTPAITFNNFTSNTAGKTLQFTAGKDFRIEGIFTITGALGNKININSTSGTQWLIDHQGSENITYANIQNSGCDAGTTTISLDPTNTDLGNNGSCWAFQIGKRVKAGVRIKGGVRIK